MQKELFILCLVLVSNSGYSQKDLSGQYQTNFPTYGMFGETLDLKCDSTFILNFRGDLQNNNTYGKWTMNKKHLILTVDTCLTKTKRYSGLITFNIVGNKLYRERLTKKNYLELQKKVIEHNKKTGDTLSLPTFGSLQMTPMDHYGKEGRQFYQKLKSFKCQR
jgi:hypothetical protein